MVTGNQADVETYNKHLFAGNVVFTNFKFCNFEDAKEKNACHWRIRKSGPL
ncbi:hypothetical protein BH11BAC5_BH11BAC5_04040 [soil metagenome]